MLKKLFYLYIVFSFQSIFAGLELDSCADSAMVLIMHQQYEQAHTYLGKVLAENPNNADALYMDLTIDATELLDYESYPIYGNKALQSADTILQKIDNLLSISPKDEKTKLLFYKANIFGFMGLVLAKQGDWLLGIKKARVSVKLLKEVVELDPTYSDASLGIGMYNYYVGQHLRWLPFMSTRAREGLADIEKAAFANSPFSFGAKHNLAWILIENREYYRADSVISLVLEQFPHNSIFLGTKARIALLNRQYEQAIDLAQQLTQRSKNRTPKNFCDLISAYQIIIAALETQEKWEECQQSINKALSIKVPAESKKISYIEKHLKYIHNSKERINNK